MSPRTKRILLREILIFVVPLVLVIVVGGVIGLYFRMKQDQLASIQDELTTDWEVSHQAKTDSLRTADSLELSAMRQRNDQDSVKKAVDNLARIRANGRFKFLFNIYYDTVYVDASLRRRERNLGLADEQLRSSMMFIYGDVPHKGLLGIVYGLLLILAYPIRLTSYAIAKLRTK